MLQKPDTSHLSSLMTGTDQGSAQQVESPLPAYGDVHRNPLWMDPHAAHSPVIDLTPESTNDWHWIPINRPDPLQSGHEVGLHICLPATAVTAHLICTEIFIVAPVNH